MTLDAYLQDRGEDPKGFAIRSDVPFTTVRRLVGRVDENGRPKVGTNMKNLCRIITATGGKVSFEDMVPESYRAA